MSHHDVNNLHVVHVMVVDCFIGDEECGHEGYVMTNNHGTFKLVKRGIFSYANFNLKKNWNK